MKNGEIIELVHTLPMVNRLAICIMPIYALSQISNVLSIDNTTFKEYIYIFDALQEISEASTPNDEYENFVNAYIETVAECVPTKLRTEQFPVK